ncbi:MAG: ABC transporter ATP-binding protein [Archangium sp.]|nr:ABC transporter ATP-binding protein [Archangium sp.]
MSTPAIQVEGLSKQYTIGSFRRRQVQALRDLSLTVEPGVVYGLLGPNGAGKSTTIKILLDLVRPTGGVARVFGHAPDSVHARAQMGFLPENPAPYEYLTGRELVHLSGQLNGLGGADLKGRVGRVLERVGMSGAADLQVRRYSKGMIQRVALAQALVTDPKLLVLDEPTSGLDVLGRQLVREIVLEQRRLGTTVLFCSHIIPDVESLCDRVAVIIAGRLVREGTVVSLLRNDEAVLEATVEEAGDEVLAALKGKLQSVEQLEGRHVLRFDRQYDREVLGALLASGARLTQLRRTQVSLEELFLKAVQESGQRVGSEIS